jgi:hypothetical protein
LGPAFLLGAAFFLGVAVGLLVGVFLTCLDQQAGRRLLEQRLTEREQELGAARSAHTESYEELAGRLSDPTAESKLAGGSRPAYDCHDRSNGRRRTESDS